MKTFVAVLLLVLVIATAIGAFLYYRHEARPEVHFAKALEFARNKMRDPESVQFRNLVPGKLAGSVCGELNAKNGMGGYVGYKPFIANETFLEMQKDFNEFTDPTIKAKMIQLQVDEFKTNCGG